MTFLYLFPPASLRGGEKESTRIEPDMVKPTTKGKLGNKEMTLSEVKG